MADALEGGVEHNLRGERIKEGNFIIFIARNPFKSHDSKK
jgi:hypothetical protein